LSVKLGHAEACPGPRCAFWERGGAVLPGGCVIERLGIDFTDEALAQHLLDLRHALERTRSSEEAAAALEELGKLAPHDLLEPESY
jgi:hypothetical protein